MTSEDEDLSGLKRRKKSRLSSKTIDILLVLFVMMLGVVTFLLFFPRH
jgi:hypothetical protein